MQPYKSVCILCQVRATRPSPWFVHQVRTYVQAQRSRPSRMILSPKTAVATNIRTRPSRHSPWAATNQTEARIKPGLTPSSAEQRRKRFTKDKDEGNKKQKEREGYHALKMQKTLAEVSYGRRTAIKARISGIDTFEEFGLLPAVAEAVGTQALEGLTEISPTPIQRLAIPALLGQRRYKRATEREEGSFKSFLLAAETGSGKTLAYLLPTIDALKRHEAELASIEEAETAKKEEEKSERDALYGVEVPPLSSEEDTKGGKPRAIVLVPTAELVDQVGAVAKALSHTAKYRAALISASYSGTVIRNRLFSSSGVDLLISTPHLLAKIAETDPGVLSEVRHLIVDEADSLFDRSFKQSTTAILDRAMPSLKQLVLCSATIPKWLDGYLRKVHPNMYRLATPNLHAIPRRVQLGVVDVDRDPYRGNKNLACADAIWQIGKSSEDYEEAVLAGTTTPNTKHVIVFVNEREKTTELAEYLASKGVQAFAFNRDSASRDRQANMLAAFTGSAATQTDALSGEEADFTALGKKQDIPKKVLRGTKVLVVTDIASRGIDTTTVKHVVLYDVPHTTIDFIHRLGRVGRMGRRGRGIVLVGRNDRKDVVREVRDGMFKGQALI